MCSITLCTLCTHLDMCSITRCILHTHLVMCAVPLWILCTRIKNVLSKTAVGAHVSNMIRTTAALKSESFHLQYRRLVLWKKAHCVVWDKKWIFTSGVDYNLSMRHPVMSRTHNTENTTSTHNYTRQCFCLICNMFRLICKPLSGTNWSNWQNPYI